MKLNYLILKNKKIYFIFKSYQSHRNRGFGVLGFWGILTSFAAIYIHVS